MKPETRPIAYSTGGVAGGITAVSVDNDIVQVIGVIVSALSIILPIVERLLAKRRAPVNEAPEEDLEAVKERAIKKFGPLVLTLLALPFAGCGTLNQSGVYAGDELLYQVETTTTASYEVIHAFVKWEHANRAVLERWPEIRTSADAMRAGAKHWFASAYALRDAYATDPSELNRTNLERALDVLRTALHEASAHMARAANP